MQDSLKQSPAIRELDGKVKSAVYIASSTTAPASGETDSRRFGCGAWPSTSKPAASRFAENDLRAKVATDSADSGSMLPLRLGHQSEATTKRVYRRKPIETTVLPGKA